VARALLGRVLVREEDGEALAGRIVEVEAYGGPADPASHARPGLTARNATMFGPPGRAYVYFTYGMHHCMNVVTGPDGTATAVLIRALEPLAGLERMRVRRGGVDDIRLMRGPGCVGQALGLDRGADGVDLVQGWMWIGSGPAHRGGFAIARSPRIGIRVAVDREWRMFLAGHPCVSGPKRILPASTSR
jgi:DNA-3-methyladenine glycosylase